MRNYEDILVFFIAIVCFLISGFIALQYPDPFSMFLFGITSSLFYPECRSMIKRIKNRAS